MTDLQSLSKKILKSFLQTFTGSGINFITSIISSYFYALFLGPALYGIWQTAKVFLSYGTFTSLGIPFVMRREFIALRKEGKFDEAEKMAHVSMTYSYIINPLIALVFIMIALVSKSEMTYKVSLFLVGILYVTDLFSSVGNIIHKGINDYKTIAIADIIYGIGTLCIVPFVHFYGFYALLTGYLVLSIVKSSFYLINRPFNYKWVWDLPVLKKMMFTAFPLFLVSIISTVFISIDRLLIAGLLNFENVGLYSLSAFIAQPITLMLSSFSIVVFTQLNEKYGKSKEPHVLEKQVFIPQRLFSKILPPAIGMGVVALPLITELLLPKYQGGITAAQINIFAILFLKLANFSSSGLFILDKLKYTAISFFIAGVIKTSGSYISLKAGYGIESVAVFTLIAYFFYNSMMLYYVNRNLGNSVKIYVEKLFESLFCPLIFIVFCFIYLKYGESLYDTLGIHNDWLWLFIGEILILIISSGFLLSALKEIKFFLKK
jgi:O-antigen/teichoic acid export membrane protein